MAGLADHYSRTYPWTLFDVRCSIEESERAVYLDGTVVTGSQVRRALVEINLLLPPGWHIKANRISLFASSDWRTVTHLLNVMTSPSHRNATLATQFVPGDDPIELLWSDDVSALVRGVDGTVGWVKKDDIGDLSLPPTFPERNDGEHLESLLDTYLGAAYLEGGTTCRGIDCSGLSQRIYRNAFGVILPRHSTAQAAWGTPVSQHYEYKTGDIIFFFDRRHGTSHLGIVRSRTVIHASSTRMSVVEDCLNEFLEMGYLTAVLSATRASSFFFDGHTHSHVPARGVDYQFEVAQ